MAHVDILQAGDGGHLTSGRLHRQSGNDALMTVVVDADSSHKLPPDQVEIVSGSI